MTRVHELRIELLTEEAFRPFGQIISAKGRPPDFRGEGGTLGWSIDFRAGTPLVTFLKTPFQGLQFKKLERHFNVTQAFIPLGGTAAVVAVAAPSQGADRDAIPQPEEVRAFLLDGTKGYALAKNTWHSLDRFPLYPPDTSFVMITDHETQDDLTLAYAAGGGGKLTLEVDYERRLGVTFAMVL